MSVNYLSASPKKRTSRSTYWMIWVLLLWRRGQNIHVS